MPVIRRMLFHEMYRELDPGRVDLGKAIPQERRDSAPVRAPLGTSRDQEVGATLLVQFRWTNALTNARPKSCWCATS